MVPGEPVEPAGQGPHDELVPAGMRLRPDSGTRLLADGTVLVGGYPVRVLRLTASGAYSVYLGNSSANLSPVGTVQVDQ